MRRKVNRHKRKEKRIRRWKNRLERSIHHFIECLKEGSRRDLVIVSIGIRKSNWRCLRCGLGYTLHSDAHEIEVPGILRLSENATVLDLMSLESK